VYACRFPGELKGGSVMSQSRSTNTVISTLMSTATSSVKKHESHTQADLRGLSTPSSSVAWASGQKGTIVRTVDSGETWVSQQIPKADGLFFRDIKAFDENTAYAMSAGPGEASCIYKTKDGGNTWTLQLQSHNEKEFFNCMAFWNPDHGMVLSDPVDGKFKIYLTKDGGGAWSPLSPSGMPAALEDEGAFAASGSCMTVLGKCDAWFATGGKTARVFHTSDAGATWEVASTPILQDSASAGIFSIAFYDLQHGVISGGDYKQPEKGGSNLAMTYDGGRTWQLVGISPQFYWSAVSFTPDHKNIMVVGPVQAAYTCNATSKAWENTWKCNVNALSFWSKDKALAVGAEGVIIEFETPKKSL
jgi:photosystem II stability/assembly factor-like uncharacterized protein